jgi:hypothetical protein
VEAEEAVEVGPTQLLLGQPVEVEEAVEVSLTLNFLDLLSQLLSALL